MSTVNFSVPADVKQAFKDTFEVKNKSVVTANVMREAAERAQQKLTSQVACLRSLERRKYAPP